METKIERLNTIAENVLKCLNGDEDVFDGYDMFTVVEIVAGYCLARRT